MTGQHISLNMAQAIQIAKDRFWQLRANDDWQGSAKNRRSEFKKLEGIGLTLGIPRGDYRIV